MFFSAQLRCLATTVIRRAFFTSRRRLASLVTLAVILSALSAANAQTSAPAGKYDHAALLKKVSEAPLVVAPMLSTAGRPLTDEQRSKVEQSAKLMVDAEAARHAGDFAESARLAQGALDIRQAVLGDRHYLTTSARVLATSMKDWAAASEDRKKSLRVSDERLAEAKRLYDAGKYVESQAAAKAALAILEKQVKADAVEIGAAQLAIGTVDIDLGLLDESDLFLGKTLEIYSAQYGIQHPQTARVLDRLGWLSVYLAGREGFRGERPRKAVDYFNQAIEALNSTVGETAEAAESLDNRGTAQQYIGNSTEALNDKLRALFIRQTVLGREAKDTGVSISNLAWLYGELGDRDKVVPFRSEALAIFEKCLPADHPYCFLEKGNLARDYVRDGKMNEAIMLFEEMIAFDEKSGDTLGVGALERAAELGAVYVRAGRGEDGIRMFESVLERARKLRESGKTEDARNILSRVARGCQTNRLYQDGVKYQAQIVEWDDADRKKEDSMEFIVRSGILGALYMQVGRLSEAERALRNVVDRTRKTVGENSIELTGALLNLARLYSQTNKLDEAEDLCEEALRIAESQSGRQSTTTAFAMMSLGRVNALQKRFGEAEFNLTEARGIFEQFRQSDPTGVIRCNQELAACHRLNGDNAKSLELLREALTMTRAWAAKADNDFGAAAIAEILHGLLESTASGDASTTKDREGWTAELKSILEGLQKRRTITHEELEWMKQLG